MARQVARQFCRLGEVHSLVYGRRASGKNGRKLTASTRVGSKSRLTNYHGFKLMFSGEKDTPLPGLFKGSLAFSQHFLYDCIPNWAAIKPAPLR